MVYELKNEMQIVINKCEAEAIKKFIGKTSNENRKTLGLSEGEAQILTSIYYDIKDILND